MVLSSRLLEWFEKRRKSKTLDLAQLQMTKAIDTVSEFEKALRAFSENNYHEATQHIDRLFQEEI